MRRVLFAALCLLTAPAFAAFVCEVDESGTMTCEEVITVIGGGTSIGGISIGSVGGGGSGGGGGGSGSGSTRA